MTPIERAARALCAIDDVDPDSSLGGKGQNFLWTEYANVHVRAVLTAIREPSEIAAAGLDGRFYPSGADVTTLWQAMIDAMLAEGE